MKIIYTEKKFRTKSLELIGQANEVIGAYAQAGYDLTLRQLYYQMVARDIIPNTERSYKNFGTLISDARMAGLVDWNRIVDRTRVTKSRPHWDHPSDVIESAYYSYNIDHWEGQSYRPRVWIEKDALTGVISRTCTDMDIPFLACKGYMSQSAMWRDSQIAIQQEKDGLIPVIIYLGDHDPSGMDMTRDIGDRMNIFGANYNVERIALNYSQVEELNPPPNPAKLSDTRAEAYVEEYGYSSWELDALEPEYINVLIRSTVTNLIDQEQWDHVQARLAHHKSMLKAISENYQTIEDHLTDEGII